MTKAKKCNIYMICLLSFGVFYQFCFLFFPMNWFFSDFGELFYPGITVLLFFIFTGENPKRVFRLKKLNIKNILLILALAALFRPVAGAIGAITNLVFPNQIIQNTLGVFSSYPVWYSFVIVSILPAILEEMSFRGVVLYSFKDFNLRTAAIMSGVYFGFFHLNFNQFFYACILGFLMVYIVHYTRSIFASVLFHFTFNSLSLPAIYLLNSQENSLQDQTVSFQTILPLAINIVIYFLFFWLVFRQFKKYNQKSISGEKILVSAPESNTEIDQCNTKQKIITPAFFIILSIFIAFAIFVQIFYNIKR